MEDISLHILDIVENSIRAGARTVDVTVAESRENDLLTVTIRDDGEGMDKDAIDKALDPFFTTKEGKRVGLGLPLLYQSAKEGGGGIVINSEKGKGCEIIATFRLSNIDTRPMGNIGETMKVLKATHPEIKFELHMET